jgi:hypothetical protein
MTPDATDAHTGEVSERDRRAEHDRRPRRRNDERPVLPRTSREEEVGWGDEPGERDDEWYRRERPPHHE